MVNLFPTVDRNDPNVWKMYSYERPASMVWNIIGQVMTNKGYPEEEIKAWFQSKSPRWALDGSLGDVLENVVKEWAEKEFLDKEIFDSMLPKLA